MYGSYVYFPPIKNVITPYPCPPPKTSVRQNQPTANLTAYRYRSNIPLSLHLSKQKERFPKMVEFNKMFVMLPVMLAARKLDGEDPDIIFLLRCVYGAVQSVSLLFVLFTYFKASAAAGQPGVAGVKIYVSPPPQVSVFILIIDILP